jgi:integrase/recombinase XerD
MKLCDAISRYVAYKQAIGMVFVTESTILRAFMEKAGPNTPIAKIESDAALQYLNGRGPVTLFWHRKHDALTGLWKFAIQHGWTDRSPLPARRPKEPAPFIPYIYSREELRRLLDGTSTYQHKWRKLEPVTLRAILLLMYGAGLRTGEPLRLTCADVGLTEAIISIRFTKFYKSRRIALNGQLLRVLAEYDNSRCQSGQRRGSDDPFFTYKNGDPVKRFVLEDAFFRLRKHVGIARQNARYQPRLHDLRHTFAVHRLTAWYQTGADVQHLLPALCTHLGHISLSGTQRYLTMTPELLAEAALRFANYAEEVNRGQA